MYLLNEMIDMGLKKNKKFTTLAHREVAIRVCIGNPEIRTKNHLVRAVEIINSVPVDRIQTLTIHELLNEFRFPFK